MTVVAGLGGDGDGCRRRDIGFGRRHEGVDREEGGAGRAGAGGDGDVARAVVAAAAMVNVAVIWVALTTATLLTVTPVEETVDGGAGNEVRAGEGDGNSGALHAARRSDEVRPARRC